MRAYDRHHYNRSRNILKDRPDPYALQSCKFHVFFRPLINENDSSNFCFWKEKKNIFHDFFGILYFLRETYTDSKYSLLILIK
jgi:hypothetical protein